ncbi:hypothetical protein DH2020_024023 [Rehmannia glutinosa]|uniref:DUF7870 domain-containing protein n=1 Tax=Rehmannia glutinosa TaxID=99300 RepID=A0ABR0W954_REHGL
MDKSGRETRPKKGGGPDVNDLGIGLKSDTLLVIKLPDSRALRIMSKSLFLAMVLLALPSIYSITMRASSSGSLYEHDDSDSANGFKILPILLRNLVEEGLIKKGHKGFVLGAGIGDIEDDFEFLRDAGIDLLTGADLKKMKNEVAHQVFDFVFASSFQRIQLVDGILKDNGLVISPLGRDPSNGLRLLSSYKIVYLRRFENTVVAMRKMGASSDGPTNSKEILCGVTSEEKKAALKGLEDVYLEPPRRAALELKSRFISRKIKFLPDLLKDSLDEYPRRVFISDDSSAVDWFYKNYPMRDQEFEVYNVEVGVNNDGSLQETGVSTWLTKKVKREDYVVMKAEAQVVEEMLKDKTLCLVDELFLECKNQWVDGEEENGSKRAYWQCLTLYGKVRDEGIAVHQWWD